MRGDEGGVQGEVNGSIVALLGTGDWGLCLVHCHAFLASLWPCLNPDPDDTLPQLNASGTGPPGPPGPLMPGMLAGPRAVPTVLKPCKAEAGGPLFVDPLSAAFFATSNYGNVITMLRTIPPPL